MDWSACCMKSRSRASTAAASTTTGLWAPAARTCWTPGDTPMQNLQFMVFLSAVIKAVDEYADLLRTAVATPGNDHRLGANEAPPAIISIFVGEELEAVIDAICSDSPYAGPVKMKMDLGVDVLPKFSKDTTDRNRTSPFAFTGNKFEFRMPGSAENLSDANFILNTAVAKSLRDFVDETENAADFEVRCCCLGQEDAERSSPRHLQRQRLLRGLGGRG